MSATHYLAVDLGAESGRVMLGSLDGEKLSLEQIHRFENRVMKIADHLHWDLNHLEREIFAGLERATQKGVPISGISVDSWAVDYVLLDRNGATMGPPFCYRDSRNLESSARVTKKLSFPVIYEETGIQFLPFNTLYQFAAEDPARLQGASGWLTIADYFNFRLSGVAAIDASMASTTQFYNPRTKSWSDGLLSGIEVSPALLPKIVPSGTILGSATGKLGGQPAFADTKIIASCSHDTGAAVAAVPLTNPLEQAYLSSGTWSLLGAELTTPIITEAARAAGFTNEIGLGGSVRFLKNIAGLWVVQECARAWKAAGQIFSYEELTRLADESGPATSHLSLKDPRFLTAGNMPEKIAALCHETSQPPPRTPGETIRLVLEGLAAEYAKTFLELEKVTGTRMTALHIVGGGIHNGLLNQLTADATGRPVIAGPAEATAIGNILIQALALGRIDSARDIRHIVENSFPTRAYAPRKTTPTPRLSTR